VDSKSLTRRQAGELRGRVGVMLGYTGKLLRRMQRRGWPADDPLYAKVARAEKALHELHVRLIYLAVPPGNGPALGEASLQFKRAPKDKRLRDRDEPWGKRGRVRGGVRAAASGKRPGSGLIQRPALRGLRAGTVPRATAPANRAGSCRQPSEL